MDQSVLNLMIRPNLDRLLDSAKLVESLYDHQIAVYSLLVKWDAPIWVREAGLLNFVYGHQFLEQPIVVFRSDVAEAVGELSERLIVLFSALNRRRIRHDSAYMNRITGKVYIDLYQKDSRNIREALDLIEAADLMANHEEVPLPLVKRLHQSKLIDTAAMVFCYSPKSDFADFPDTEF